MAFNASPQYPGSYLGVRAPHPPNINYSKFLPTPNDWQGYVVGDLWIYIPNPTSSAGRLVFMLVSLVGNQALWIEFTSSTGTLTSLQGNSGGIVPPNGSGYINVVGDGVTINVVGNPGTNTLTINAITNGTQIISTLTGNTGGAVSPTSGNINIVGDGVTVRVTGNPGTSTLTISAVGSGTVETITGDSGGAISPTAGTIVLTGGTTGLTFAGTTSPGKETLTGILVPANGGTGTNASSYTTDGVFYWNGTNFATTSAGSAGQVLTSNGAGVAPTYQAGGGGGSVMFTNDTGSTSASNAFTLKTNTPNSGFTAPANAGATMFFAGSGTAMTLSVNDISQNMFIGTNSGNGTYQFAGNTQQNIGIGVLALTAISTGSNPQHQNGNIAIGYKAMTAFQDIGSNAAKPSTCIGYQTLSSQVHGYYNVCLGSSTGVNYTTTEANNILIGSNIGGTASESNTLRIGNGTGSSDTQINQCFISGIRGITTSNNNAIAVLVDSANQLGTVSSSIRYKEDIHALTGSEAIYDLKPVMFTYKKDKTKSWGLIAEEVKETIPALVVHDDCGQVESVKYHELPVLLLAEIQKLKKRIEELEKK